MKKLILNLLTIFAWIYQIFCVIGIIMWIVMGGVVLFGIHNPDFRAGFESGRGIKGVSVDNYIGAIVVVLLSLIMMSVAAFLICRYARLIVKNIKQEVYFDDSNLNLLKKLLISVAGYTLISIIDYIIFITHRTWFAKSSNNVLYPSGVTTGLLFLAVLYVVYLVFKYGMKVQEDADSII